MHTTRCNKCTGPCYMLAIFFRLASEGQMMLILRCASGRELAEAINLARHPVRPHATAAQQQEHGPATNAYSRAPKPGSPLPTNSSTAADIVSVGGRHACVCESSHAIIKVDTARALRSHPHAQHCRVQAAVQLEMMRCAPPTYAIQLIVEAVEFQHRRNSIEHVPE